MIPPNRSVTLWNNKITYLNFQTPSYEDITAYWGSVNFSSRTFGNPVKMKTENLHDTSSIYRDRVNNRRFVVAKISRDLYQFLYPYIGYDNYGDTYDYQIEFQYA